VARFSLKLISELKRLERQLVDAGLMPDD